MLNQKMPYKMKLIEYGQDCKAKRSEIEAFSESE
jgi:hypothetical protein